ncbi:hypothetical protein B0T49_12140 [Chromobacterium violaceum]|uniref:hypothetical protein n=1 Tax=Chromobacterium violaceum TaxID=536 RepID=UPI0009D9D544|nr:hypothetical protein [Chromobacterium violaceum]OQS47700.1 hypothetical protein B0T48_11425 [Chromobacterium violaceum]OQS49830.1 hypothetical protein B0T49_12140 [Chromobacterium violaceum]
MTTTSTFTNKELSRLKEVQAAKSGSAEDQFIQECIGLVREWLSTRQLRKDPPPPDNQAILFIFAEAPLIDFGFDKNIVNEPRRIRRKQGTLGEGIVVCNQNFKVMLKVRESLTIEDAYSFAENQLSTLSSFTIAKVGQHKLQIHRTGQNLEDWLDDPEEIPININETLLTPDVIAEDLKRFHHSYLSTPLARAARHMWTLPEEMTQYRLGELPEQHIQSFLLSHLDGLYGRASVFVHEEIKNQGGRVDIWIERPSLGLSGKVNTVLELKVLAPTKSPNENYKWARKGVEQANSYRNHDTDTAFACLFDARREKQDMPELTPYALEKNVRLEQYLMDVPADSKKKPAALSEAS